MLTCSRCFDFVWDSWVTALFCGVSNVSVCLSMYIVSIVYLSQDSLGNLASVTRRVIVVGHGCLDSTMYNYDPGAIVVS